MIVSLMLASVTSVMSPIPRHMAADRLSRFWKEVVMALVLAAVVWVNKGGMNSGIETA